MLVFKNICNHLININDLRQRAGGILYNDIFCFNRIVSLVVSYDHLFQVSSSLSHTLIASSNGKCFSYNPETNAVRQLVNFWGTEPSNNEVKDLELNFLRKIKILTLNFLFCIWHIPIILNILFSLLGWGV